MQLITAKFPDGWAELEDLVAAILTECGMNAQRQVSLQLPRGSVDVDVLAEETVDGIIHRIICECKNWRVNIPKEVVHAFRTVMQETGVNRGYIVSRVGFQSGAIEAARATNIELVTFEEFQKIHFDKWISKCIWAIERAIKAIYSYYEPWGPPGYAQLQDDEERAAYDAALDKYLFASLMLRPYAPYTRSMVARPLPEPPFDVSELGAQGIEVPPDLKSATTYREFFQLLEGYARAGISELRAINPITRDRIAVHDE